MSTPAPVPILVVIAAATTQRLNEFAHRTTPTKKLLNLIGQRILVLPRYMFATFVETIWQVDGRIR